MRSEFTQININVAIIRFKGVSSRVSKVAISDYWLHYVCRPAWNKLATAGWILTKFNI